MRAVDDELLLRAFRSGSDTFRIAKSMNMTEATVSRHIWVARCREKNRPAIYIGKNDVLKRISDQPVLKSA